MAKQTCYPNNTFYNTFYKLNIKIDTDMVDESTIVCYKNAINLHNMKVNNWKKNYSEDNICIDAGFDLFVPNNININRESWANKINMGIHTSMTFDNKPCSYYLYSRSSTPIKTPLRLANSVGIIDSGYTGHIIALFDNVEKREYTILKNDRLVQICSPNITYPLEVRLVNSINSTNRGNNGFGSTG